jgi:hypothetical protein
MPAVDKVKSITLFVVVNSDGQFFRRKGYGGSGGSGKTWVDDAATARIYVKIGPARSIVTFFTNAYPKFPPPTILKLSVGKVEVLDESDRIQKAKERIQKSQAAKELRAKNWELEQAQKQLAEAQERVNKLKKKNS